MSVTADAIIDGREQARLAALHEYGLLDTPADDELAAVVRVAAAVAGVPNATLNLIDENRQCQLTTTGFTGCDSARSDSMCNVHFRNGQFVHVPDAREDPRFAANPWVTGALSDVRFYASAPLVTPEGHALGSLCIFDNMPGRLDQDQIARITDLAGVVLALFERRRQARRNAELAAELADTVAELRRSNRELEQFAGVVSHDLRSPLSAVHGCLEMLTDSGLPAGELAWLTRAQRATDRMAGLIDALLDYARSGHVVPAFGPVPLVEVVDQVVADLRPAILEAHAEIVVTRPLPVVQGDSTLLRQLIQNLIANSVKYRSPERACRVTVSGTVTAGQATVTVADNGIGIRAEDRARVFGMFTRVDEDSDSGYGIGLATCERIVSRHGGEIWVAEQSGPGTAVRFRLPVRR